MSNEVVPEKWEAEDWRREGRIIVGYSSVRSVQIEALSETLRNEDEIWVLKKG